MYCRRCKAENQQDGKYCWRCGDLLHDKSGIPKFCNYCGEKNISASYCTRCGAKVTRPTIREVVTDAMFDWKGAIIISITMLLAVMARDFDFFGWQWRWWYWVLLGTLGYLIMTFSITNDSIPKSFEQVQLETIYCSYCKNKLKPGIAHCTRCGKAIPSYE